jgi:hypothetical protein
MSKAAPDARRDHLERPLLRMSRRQIPPGSGFGKYPPVEPARHRVDDAWAEGSASAKVNAYGFAEDRCLHFASH